jgi:hypothetical protein
LECVEQEIDFEGCIGVVVKGEVFVAKEAVVPRGLRGHFTQVFREGFG